MTPKPPAALMSYARSDDTDKHLSTFRERLSHEVRIQTGREFPIFQDIKDIQWGQSWQQRIDDSLDEITFLIAIITPSFFNSDACRTELERFIERERRLGRNDLILPVYFVESDVLSDPELRATDELAEVIATRQFADWRELRFEPFTNPQVRKTLAQLAVQIRDALPRVQALKKARAKTDSTVQPAAATTSKGTGQTSEGPTTKREPPTVIVDAMHRGNFATINEAIQNGKPGTRILVRPGIYREALVIDKPLEIIGDGERGDVVIQVEDTNVMRFQTTMGRVVNLTLRLMGGGGWYCVDIRQGRLELEDCDITSGSIACVCIRGGADPRLRRNRIHDGKDVGVMVQDGAQGTLEDNDIFSNTLSGVEIKTAGNPTLRRNRIYDNKHAGVHMHDEGQGTLEDNDIFGNGLAGVQIKSTIHPIMRRNRIRDGKKSGVLVLQGGQGTIDDNDIIGNAFHGVEITTGNPIVRNNRINKNAMYAVRIRENGGGTFENNDITENGTGPWLIAEDSVANVTRRNNKE